MSSEKIAVVAGSFDPVTVGHLDIIKRASKLYDKVIVGVLSNGGKTPLFSADERIDMISHVISDLPNVCCDSFDGLLVDFLKSHNAAVIVKGLRTVADFEYEFQMALLNKALNPEYETMFMMTNSKFSYISSSMVKEVAKFQGQLDGLVPEYIAEKIKEVVS